MSKVKAFLSLLTWVPQHIMPKKKRKSEKLLFKSFLATGYYKLSLGQEGTFKRI